MLYFVYNQKARNVYGTNLISRNVDNQTAYYLYNGHADVVALVDGSGNTLATYYYDAFGNIVEQTGNVDNNITYAGYQYDKETGKYYLNARMYDPVTARFMQEDTYRGNVNDPLSLNLYTYCHNEPLMYWDYSGHTDWNYNRVQKNGSKNNNSNDVMVMQKMLYYLGYLDHYDGNYGDKTEKAVKRFQQHEADSGNYGWMKQKDVDGIAGGKTWALLGLPEPGSNQYYYMLDKWDTSTTSLDEVRKNHSEVAPKLEAGQPIVQGYDTNPKQGQYIQTGIEGVLGVAQNGLLDTGNGGFVIANWARDKGVEYMKSHNLPTSADNEADAYRHFLWNARMTREIGYDEAQNIANNHEATNIIVFQGAKIDKTITYDMPLSSLMDLNNNKVGRDAAISPKYKNKSYDDIFKSALSKGDLITSLGQVPERYGFNPNLVFDKEVAGEVILTVRVEYNPKNNTTNFIERK